MGYMYQDAWLSDSPYCVCTARANDRAVLVAGFVALHSLQPGRCEMKLLSNQKLLLQQRLKPS